MNNGTVGKCTLLLLSVLALAPSASALDCASACLHSLENKYHDKHPECEGQTIADDCCVGGVGEFETHMEPGPDGQPTPHSTTGCNNGPAADIFFSCVDARQDDCDNEYTDEVADELPGCYDNCVETGRVESERKRVWRKLRNGALGVVGSGFGQAY